MAKERKYFTLALVISFGLLAIDTLTPLGYAEWVLYIIPLLIAYRAENSFLTLNILGLDGVMLALGLFLSPQGYDFQVSLINRLLGFISITIFTLVINNLIQARKNLKTNARKLTDANTELEAFSYSASHDLRAPLRSIDQFSRILLEDHRHALDTKAVDHLSRIIAAAGRMNLLITDLISLAKISRQELNIVSVDLSGLIKDIFSELQNTALDRQIKFIIQPGLSARADSGLIRIALTNLAGNAFKYSSKKEIAEIEFGITDNDGKRTFFIRDNGAGFDIKQAVNLFKPFHRLHPESEFTGTGIGLAIVDRIIRKHGGQVWGEGVPGRGATFYFTLPVK